MATSRKSFWYHVWNDCGKPRDGHVYRHWRIEGGAKGALAPPPKIG